MPRVFRERPRLAVIGVAAALLLAAIGAIAGAGLASGGEGVPAEPAATLDRARGGERQAIRQLEATRAALDRTRGQLRGERRRSELLRRKARRLQRTNRTLRRALRRERGR